MKRAKTILRSLAVAVYATAMLGALIVPHAHHLSCQSGCCGSHCSLDEHAASESAAPPHHHHHGCGHSHSHPGGAADHQHAGEHPDSPTSPFDEDCPLCQFLAQAVQLTSPPQIVAVDALVLPVSRPRPNGVTATTLETPPVRGPPLA